MIRSFKYRLYPNKAQELALFNILNLCKDLYNGVLEERISYYKKYGKSLSYKKQQNELPELKELVPEYQDIHSQVLQNVLVRVDLAFEGFFRRWKNGEKNPGFPRFKGRDRIKSFTFAQIQRPKSKNIKEILELNPYETIGGVCLQKDAKHLDINNVGLVRIKYHREMSGNIKTATIKREGDSWYVIFACEDVVIDPNKYNKVDHKVSGIDLGISSFATLSDGEKIYHSRHLKEAKEKFVKLHQELSSKKKGSKNRDKAKNRLAKSYNKIKNARTNEFHHIANELINTHDQIFIEDLDIAEMLEKKSAKKKNEKKKKEGKPVMSEKSASTLRFNILDAAWGKFVHILQYKAEEAGNVIITKVPARNTSKMCSCCGNIKTDLQLYDRVYYCSNVSCQAWLDRDINAAINIKKKGLEQTLP